MSDQERDEMGTDEGPLTVAAMVQGLAVAYTGEDFNEGFILTPPPTPQFLYRGHPGRIARPDPYHLSVDWVGLEDEVMSFGMGWTPTTDNVGDSPAVFHDIVVITETEFDRRRRRILAGGRP